jgi:hypothetical protein
VDVLAGIRVTDGPGLLEIVSQGGSGYFFGHCAEKISIIRAGCENGQTPVGNSIK